MNSSSSLLLKNGEQALFRMLATNDSDNLYQYLTHLSHESKSRFGPHPFDKNTIDEICSKPQEKTRRYVAEINGSIIAYMLMQPGLIKEDEQRYNLKNVFFDTETTITFAPSIADDFQSSGLGTQMLIAILKQLRKEGFKTIVLWGGVQATNTKAVHFYEKNGFTHQGSFWFNDKDNHDMILYLH